MLALADMVDLLTNEFAGLCGRRLAGALVRARPLERGFLRHKYPFQGEEFRNSDATGWMVGGGWWIVVVVRGSWAVGGG